MPKITESHLARGAAAALPHARRKLVGRHRAATALAGGLLAAFAFAAPAAAQQTQGGAGAGGPSNANPSPGGISSDTGPGNGTIGDSAGNSANVFLGSGARLGGSGTIYGDVSSNGSATVAPGNSPGTMIVTGDFSLGSSDAVEFELGEPGVVGGPNNDLIIVGGLLTLDNPTLDVVSLGGQGFYRLFNYGALASGAGFGGINLPTGFTATALFNQPGVINLRVSDTSIPTQYWDGEDTTAATNDPFETGTPTSNGGPGVWNSTNTNWTTPPDYNTNSNWQGGNAIFAGPFGGTVSVEGNQNFASLTFNSDYYWFVDGGAGSLTGGPGALIDVDTGLTAIIAVPLLGGNGLTKIGNGLLTLRGANSYTGGTTVFEGLVGFNGPSALGSGNITLDGGGLQWDGVNTFDISSRLNPLGFAGGTFDTNGNNVTLASAISGTGALTKAGAGVLTLTATNTYSGGTLITGGALSIASVAALGSGDLTLRGGVLQTTGSLTVVRPVHLLGLGIGGGFDTVAGTTLTLSSTVDGDGPLIKFGGGTLRLTGSNSYSGPTVIAGGTLETEAAGLGFTQELQLDSGGRLRLLEDVWLGDIQVFEGGGVIDTGGHFVDVFGGVNLLGRLTKEGSGTLYLSDFLETGTGGGGIEVLGGTLALAWDGAAGTGRIGLADGTTLLNAACGCGELNLVNDISVALGGTATINTAGLLTTLNGVISGGNLNFISVAEDGGSEVTFADFASLAASVPGVIVLTNQNSYGATFIGSNTLLVLGDRFVLQDPADPFSPLVYAGSGTLGTGPLTFEDDTAAFAYARTGSYDFGGTLTGAGTLIIDTDGTFTLSGSNSSGNNFTGTVIVDAGTLFINGNFGDVDNNSALLFLNGCGCSTATLGGSGTFHGSVDASFGTLTPGTSPGTMTIGGDLILGAASVIDFELGQPGVINGPNNDLFNVGGDLILDGTANIIGFGPNYGPGYYRLINYGGSLTDNGLLLGSVDGGLSGTVLTNINGQVNLLLGGPGIVQYWDGTDITGATAEPTGRGGDGTWNANNANWTTLAGTTNDTWQSGVGIFAGAAGGTVTVEGVQSFQELRFETDGYALRPLDASSGLMLNNSAPGSFSIIDVSSGLTADIGVILQGGGLDKRGAGTLVLSAPNTYTGRTDVTAGTLRLGISNAIRSNSALFVAAGATFDLDGFFNAVASLSGAGNVLLGNGGELQFGADGTSTSFSGSVSGSGSFVKTGGGTFTLNGSVNLSTGVSSQVWNADGTFAIGSSGSVTADFIQNSGTLNNAGTINAAVQNFGSFTNSGTTNGGTQNFGTFINTGTMGSLNNVAGTASNSGTINGNVSNASGPFTSTGIINGDLENSTAVQLQGQLNGLLRNLSSSATVTLTGTTTGITHYSGAAGSTFDLAGFNTTVGGISGFGSILVGSARLTVGGNNSSTSFGGVISGADGSLFKQGTGTLTLTNANTYSGHTQIDQGALVLRQNGSLASTGALTVSANGTFDIDNTDQTVTILSGSGTILLGSGTLTVGNLDSSSLFTGQFRETVVGSGGLTKIGAGTLSLGGTSDFHGATRIDAGRINLISANALSPNSSLQIAAGAQIDISVFSHTVRGLGGAGSILSGFGGVLTVNQLGADTFSGGMSGAGGLTLGSGFLTLTGSGLNTYSGATTVNGGVLIVQGVNTLSAASVLNIGSAGQVELFASQAAANLAGSGRLVIANGAFTLGSNNGSSLFSGVISSLGSLVKVGNGTLTLTGANTYSGGTSLNAGGIAVGGNSALGTGTLTMANNTILRAATNATLANDIQLGNSGVLIDSGAFIFTLDGVISGSGGFNKVGSGTLRLAGVNTYTGTTTINAGTLDLRMGGVLAGRVINNATFVSGGTLNGDLINNNNALATNVGTINGFVLNSGTFNQLLGAINGTLDNNGAANLAGQINGLLSNQSTVTLTGGLAVATFNQTATGSTNLAGFNLTIGDIFGSGSINLGTGALTVGGGNGNTLFAGAISGTGTLTKVGTGTLALSAANTYTGLTTVSEGALQITASGSLAGAVLNNANLLNQGTIAGLVTNNGLLFSSGTLGGGLTNGGTAQIEGVLNGAVNNQAGLIVLQGTTTGIGRLTQSAGAAFDLANFNTSFGSLAGAGNVRLGSGFLTVGSDNSDTTFAGTITNGNGGLTKVGTGTLTLTGVNTYTGPTTVSAGTLSLGATGFITGVVLNNATFINAGTANGGIANTGTLNSTGIINVGLDNSGIVQLRGQLNGFVNNNAGTITLTGSTTGITTFTQAAGATLDLAGFDLSIGTLSGGGFILLGGAAQPVPAGAPDAPAVDLVVTPDVVLATLGVPIAAAPPLAALPGTESALPDRTVLLPGGDAALPDTTLLASGLSHTALPTPGLDVALPDATLLASSTVTVPVEVPRPALKPIGGAATLASPAPGNGAAASSATLSPVTATVQGARLNLADAMLTPAPLQVAFGALRAGLVNAGPAGGTAMIAADGPDDGALAGPEAEEAAVATTGERVALVEIEAPTLEPRLEAVEIAEPSLLPAATGATLTVGSSNLSSLFSGVISGDGILAKVGTGTLVLTGANTYTGGTVISGGALQIGNGGTTGSIVGPITNNSLLIINRSDAITLASAISGTGMFVQVGAGTTTLTGANSYSGGTLVQSGRLRGNATSLQGDIQNNAALEFAQGSAGTFAGRLFGAGLLEKSGAGLLTFTGDNSNFTGETRILGGELRINSLLARSRVIVGTGTTLSGTGIVGGFVAQNGATVAPGANGVGMLGVNGNLQFGAGSTYLWQLGSTGGDLILANGAGQLDGTLALSSDGSLFRFNTTLVILQADLGRTGTFATVTGLGGFGQAYAPEVVYTATQVQLVLRPNQLLNILGANPGTPNQRSTLQRIDTAVAAGFDPQGLFALYLLSPAAALAAGADALSGEIYPTATRVALHDERLVREATIGRLRATQDAADGSGLGVWGQVFGSWGSGDGDGNAAGYDADRTGFVLGLDGGREWDGGSWRIGVLGHYGTSRIDVDARASRAEIERAGIGLYAGIELGDFRTRVGATYSTLDLESRRTAAFTGFSETVAGSTDGDMFQAFGEIAYRIEAGRNAFVEPFLLAGIARVDFDEFSEAGGAPALRVSEQDNELGTVTAGLRGETIIRMGERTNLRLGGSIGGRHAFGDRMISTLIALDASPAQSFPILSAAIDRFSIVGNLDATLDLSERLSLTVGYSGVVGENARDHAVRATVSLRF